RARTATRCPYTTLFRSGETRLKTLEAEVVQEALLYRSAVIRVSGQTLLHSNNYGRFSATGPVVCLVASLDSVLQNLHLTLGARYHDPNERSEERRVGKNSRSCQSVIATK